jgi:hypothetical protein
LISRKHKDLMRGVELWAAFNGSRPLN